jgi:hypothetical protein
MALRRGRVVATLSLLALVAVVALPLESVPARPAANEWAGTWDTDWGRMVLTQSGARVTGTYAHDDGRIEGTANGLVLTGTWNEAPTRAGPSDAGSFRFTMKPDLRSFSGDWTYEGGGGGTWVAERVGAPPSTKAKPTVVAYPFSGTARPASRVPLRFSVKDESGKATVHVRLYEGGASIVGFQQLRKATGQRQVWKALLAADLGGPLFFCAWAKNAAGQTSAGAPRSSCAWVPMLVAIERVSNGCGGAGWETVVTVENVIGNTSVYVDSNVDPRAPSYTVDFTAACDLHGAGYSGVMVKDAINGGVVDYRTWSQKRVDDKFLEDMQTLCRRQIPSTAKVALAKCLAKGGALSIGAASRYTFVRDWGERFFDADLTKAGTQRAGPRA